MKVDAYAILSTKAYKFYSGCDLFIEERNGLYKLSGGMETEYMTLDKLNKMLEELADDEE